MSNAEKVVITAKCQRFIDEVLKPRFLPAIRPIQFNYPIDILGKWHGNHYRFVQRYRSGPAILILAGSTGLMGVRPIESG